MFFVVFVVFLVVFCCFCWMFRTFWKDGLLGLKGFRKGFQYEDFLLLVEFFLDKVFKTEFGYQLVSLCNCDFFGMVSFLRVLFGCCWNRFGGFKKALEFRSLHTAWNAWYLLMVLPCFSLSTRFSVWLLLFLWCRLALNTVLGCFRWGLCGLKRLSGLFYAFCLKCLSFHAKHAHGPGFATISQLAVSVCIMIFARGFTQHGTQKKTLLLLFQAAIFL